MTDGTSLKPTQIVIPDGAKKGTDYNTATSEYKPERIVKEGKVYVLKGVKSGSDSEKGIVTDTAKKVTYVYELVKDTPNPPVTPGHPIVPPVTPGHLIVPTTTPEQPVAPKGKLANTGIESTSSTVLGALSAMLGLGGLFLKNRKSDKE